MRRTTTKNNNNNNNNAEKTTRSSCNCAPGITFGAFRTREGVEGEFSEVDSCDHGEESHRGDAPSVFVRRASSSSSSRDDDKNDDEEKGRSSATRSECRQHSAPKGAFNENNNQGGGVGLLSLPRFMFLKLLPTIDKIAWDPRLKTFAMYFLCVLFMETKLHMPA